MNVTNEWGANYYVLVGTKQLNSINAFTTAPYSNGGNVVFWIALNSQKQWGFISKSGSYQRHTFTLPIPATQFVIPIPWLLTSHFVTADISSYNLSSVTVYGYSYDSGNTISGIGYLACCS